MDYVILCANNNNWLKLVTRCDANKFWGNFEHGYYINLVNYATEIMLDSGNHICIYIYLYIYVISHGRLVVQDAHVAGDDFVLEYSAGRNIDTITVIGNDDDGALWEKKRSSCS